VIARTRLHRLSDERGQSLVLALLVLTVLAIALGTVIFFTSSNQRNSAYEKATQVSRSLAEAGVNNGISVLANAAQTNSANLISSTLLSTQTSTYPGGSVQWWGTFDGNEQSTSCPPPAVGSTVYACVGTWTLNGTSTVTNPTGGTAAIHRTVTAKMQVYRAQTSNPADVWNWVFSPKVSGTNACDTSFTNSLTLNVRVWVGGNLCANNTVKFQKSLYVGGYLNLGNPQATVGTNSTPIAAPEEVYVGAGCVYSNKPFYNPCVKDGTIVSGKAAQTNVFTNTLYTQNGTPTPPFNPLPATDQIFPNVAPPPLCWGLGDCPPSSSTPIAGGWYSVASPGPLHPCTTSSTSPAGNALPQFDNNGSFDNSVPGVFNLTPDSYSYTCKTAGGELSWNTTTRTLTVEGVIFIDGSATANTSGNQAITYKGWGNSGACTSIGSCEAVLFLSGTFLISGEHLCAVANAAGTDCDQSGAWDPNKKLLIIATHNQGGQLSANDGVEINTNKSTFQGGLYAKYAIAIQSGGTVQGPLVSGTQTIADGQSGLLSFPTLTISPFAINSPPAFMLCIPSQPCHPFAYTG
jgi:Tfp pilus assembly protein PilX